MILTKYLDIRITPRNIGYYSNYFHDIKINDLLNINVNILHEGSNIKIKSCCDNCGKEKDIPYVKYNYYIEKGGFYYCENCKWIKSKETNLEKYGCENPLQNKEIKDKVKDTLLKKYGVDNPMKNDIIKNKNKNTVIKKYKVDNVFQSEEIKEKIKKTNLEKYGVESHNKSNIVKEHKKKTYLSKFGNENIFASPLIKDQIKNTMLEKYGIDNCFRNGEIRDKFKFENELKWFENIKKNHNLNFINVDFKKKEFEIYCNKGHNFKITFSLFYNRNRDVHRTEICTICNPINKQESGLEIQIRDFIKNNYQGEIKLGNNTIIKPYEIDIYLPVLKLGFEFNGLYWHSEIYKNKNYHLNKTNLSEDKGVNLIQIYEDDWLYKQDIVKSKILNLIGKSEKIMARKCEVKEINDNKLVRNFLENNHLQGLISSKIKIGLFHNDELVSLMTFGSFRKAMDQKSSENLYELLRFCNKLNTNVIGGASKLFNYFIKNYNPKEIISYADRSWSNGELYKKLGFKLVHKTEPNYFYIINGMRKHRFGFRKDKLIKEGNDLNKTEHEIMLDKGIFRIYDSGSYKFEKIDF